MQKQQERLHVLDSFRAVAALMVVCFHYFYRWSVEDTLLPAAPFAHMTKFGWLGVEFFFIISGFVITMTLSKTRTILEFCAKRFARLFPAMAVCATITFLVDRALGVAPFSDVELVDFIPSLLFLDPEIIHRVTGLQAQYIAGAYWSLIVEVKFYVLAALLHFARPTRFMLNLAILSAVLMVARYLHQSVDTFLQFAFFPDFAPFFVAGVAFHDAYKRGFRSINSALIMLAFVASLGIYADAGWVALVLISAIYAVFLLFILGLTRFLANRYLAAIGTASYSLYLIHEGVGIPLLARLPNSPIITLFVMGAMILFSLALYKFFETPTRIYLTRLAARVDRPRVPAARSGGAFREG